jgi:hypothetical protein
MADFQGRPLIYEQMELKAQSKFKIIYKWMVYFIYVYFLRRKVSVKKKKQEM